MANAIADWEYVHVGIEGDNAEIGGLQVWQQDWRRVHGYSVTLPHPSYYHQLHNYDVYEIGDALQPIRFAAGELSANVWGFYIPRRRPVKI